MPALQVAIDARLAKKGAADYAAGGKVIEASSVRASRAVGRVDARMKAAGATATKTKGMMVGLFGAFVAFAGIKGALSTIIKFEETMAVLGNVTRSTTEEMVRMEAQARKLGATTRFTASDAAEGMVELARAGFSAEEAIAAVPATLNLAQAGLLNLGEAAGFAANVIRQFGLEAAEAVRVADTLINVANSSNTNVRQLAEAMKFAGPIANALRLSVETTAAAIGTLGDRGIQASMAGTNLRGTMLALTAPTEKIERALQRLDLAYADVDPATHDFIDVLELLGDSIQQLENPMEGLGIANQIFGRRNTAAANILAENTKTIRALAEETANLDDVAQKAAEAMDNTLSGALKGLLSAIQENFLALGDQGLTGGLTKFVRWLTTSTRILAGYEDATTKGAFAARAFAEALRAVLIGGTALVALKIGRWLASTALGTRLATVAMIELRGVTVATAVTMGTSGPLMAGLTAVTGGLRALGVAVKSFFASIGPAGWVILGVTAVVELMLWLGRAHRSAAAEAEAHALRLADLRRETISLSGATEQMLTIQARISRAAERNDLQGQLVETIGLRRAIEDQIIDLQKRLSSFDPNSDAALELRGFFTWQVDIDDRPFYETATVAVEDLRVLFGEGGQDALDAYLSAFAETDLAKKLNVLRPPEPPKSGLDAAGQTIPPEPLSAAASRTAMQRLRQLSVSMEMAGEISRTTARQVEDVFDAADVHKVPLTDAIRLLGDQSELTFEQVTKLRKVMSDLAKEEAAQAAAERLAQITAGFEEQARLTRLESEVFESMVGGGGASSEGVAKALRAANNEREIAITLARARAQAEKDEIDVSVEFLNTLEATMRAAQVEADAFEDVAEARGKAAREIEEETAARERSIQSLDSFVQGLEQEARLTALTLEDRELQQALLRAEALAYNLTDQELQRYLASVEAAVRAKQALATETRAEANELDDYLAGLRRENDLLAMSSGERAVAEALSRVAAIAKREEVELTQAMADAIRYEVEERQRLENVRQGTEDLRAMGDDMERQLALLGLTNRERERTLFLMDATQAAFQKFGEINDAAQLEVAELMAAWDQLRDLQEIEDTAWDIGIAFGSAFEEFILGSATAEEAAENLLRALSQLAVTKLFTEPLIDAVAGFASGLLGGGNGGIDPQELIIKQLEQSNATILSIAAPILQTAAVEMTTAGVGMNTAAVGLNTAAIALAEAAVIGVVSANGNVFRSGSLVPFALGGIPEIINEPTSFPMSRGRRGIAGEAGPEWAIAPLERTPSGKLGANVKVEGGGGTNVVVTVHMNVHGVRDVDGFRRSKTQILGDTARAMKAAINEQAAPGQGGL